MDDDFSYVEELMLPFTFIVFGTIALIALTYVLMKAHRNWAHPEYVEAKLERKAARELAAADEITIEITDKDAMMREVLEDLKLGGGEFKEET